jgi:two-component system phosphate regulon sensor histidine kinase PhoR
VSRSWWFMRRRQALILASAALGRLAGGSPWCLLLAALGALAWQLWQLRSAGALAARRSRWRLHRPLAGPGVGGIGAHVARLRRQSRKRKRKLSRLLRQFQQATAALPDAAVVLGEDDRMLWCNGAAQPLLGLTTEPGYRFADYAFDAPSWFRGVL